VTQTATETHTTPAPGSVIAEPEMADTNYGIRMAPIGEDGDMLALGHHEPRKALAAFNRYARIICGWTNIADDRARAQDWLDRIDQRWALFTVPDPEQGEDPDYAWYSTWCSPETPGALPVTILTA
jgi:hypothetical protein